MRLFPNIKLLFSRRRRHFSPTGNAHFSSSSSSSLNQTSPPQQWRPYSLQSDQNKVLSLNTNLQVNDTNHVTNHLRYMNTFTSLVSELSTNPRNFTALSKLDSMLTNTHLLDSVTSVYVIESLCEIKKLQRAKTVLLNFKKNANVCRYFLYSLVVDCMLREAKISEVEIFWNEISGSDSEMRRIDVSDYVVYLCKFGGVWELKSVCERVLMVGWGLREQSYTALIGAFCSKNEGLLAKSVLLEMNHKGFEADDVTYVVMFQCFCRTGELYEADIILRKLVMREYKMDICIYGSFMYGLCKSGKVREAIKLFQKLIKDDCSKGTEIESLKKRRRAIFQLNCEGAVPKIMAYETFFRSLCSVGMLDEAEALLKNMMTKRTLPELCVYRSFIKALFNAGREEDALKFLKAERKKGLLPIDEITRFIISSLCGIGKVDDALNYFDDIISKGGFVSVMGVYNDILGGFWKEGRVDEAERFFERVKSATFGPPCALSYTTMLTGFCKHGDILKALDLFEEMRSKNILVTGSLYEIIIRGSCDHGKANVAYIFLSYMIESGHLVSHNIWHSLFFHGDQHGTTILSTQTQSDRRAS